MCLLILDLFSNGGHRSEQKRQKSLVSRHPHPSGVSMWAWACSDSGEKKIREGGWGVGSGGVIMLNRWPGKSSLRR